MIDVHEITISLDSGRRSRRQGNRDAVRLHRLPDSQELRDLIAWLATLK
jgi:hypothetical protein